MGTAPGRTTPGTRFATFDVPATDEVVLELATSFIALDQARRNHDLELDGRDFDAVQRPREQAWNERLGVVDVEGATTTSGTLYSNLYRLNLYPN